MSANHDSSQKIKFVYTNLYHLYKKGTEAAKSHETGKVIKAGSSSLNLLVENYQPKEFTTEKHSVFKGLKQNLSDLSDLEKRLRFMLSELEEMTRSSRRS